MKITPIFLLIVSIIFISDVYADVFVKGYTRNDGTYVQPHMRSDPNGTATDNYSYSGNTNPYTGNTGNNEYQHDITSPYYQGPDNRGNVGHKNYPR